MPENPKINRTIEVFVSYAHEDEALWDQLSKHLSNLKRRNVISVWHDRQIGAGTEWKNEIDAHLNSAHIILLLVSADFLASDYCHEIEMKRALERHHAGEARVIPIIIRDVDWTGALFAKLQSLPKDGKAITSWANRDEALRNVAEGIRNAVEELVGSLSEKLSKAESLRNWPNVIDLGERILKLVPDHQPTRSKTSSAYINKWARKIKGRELYDIVGFVHVDFRDMLKAQNVREALERDLKRANELDSSNAEFYYWQSALRDWDDYKQRISDLDRAIELDSRNGKYYYVRSKCLEKIGEEEAAQQDIERAAELGDIRADSEKKWSERSSILSSDKWKWPDILKPKK